MNDRERQVGNVLVGGIAGIAVALAASAEVGGLVRGDRPPTVIDRPSPSPMSVVTPEPNDADIRGWPGPSRNRAGTYSWKGPRFAWMHNGYAPGDGDVAIAIHQVPEGGITDGATAVIVAGHDGFYRRIGPRQEWWIVDIEGSTIAIFLEAARGTSQAEVAEAHAVIRSIRTDPQDVSRDGDLGFRLVFTLTTDHWDSG